MIITDRLLIGGGSESARGTFQVGVEVENFSGGKLRVRVGRRRLGPRVLEASNQLAQGAGYSPPVTPNCVYLSPRLTNGDLGPVAMQRVPLRQTESLSLCHRLCHRFRVRQG